MWLRLLQPDPPPSPEHSWSMAPSWEQGKSTQVHCHAAGCSSLGAPVCNGTLAFPQAAEGFAASFMELLHLSI